jgi:hypothetical protein
MSEDSNQQPETRGLKPDTSDQKPDTHSPLLSPYLDTRLRGRSRCARRGEGPKSET